MHKIDTDGAVAGAFVDKDPVNSIPGTIVDAAWLNAIQTEITSVIEAAGIVLTKGQNDQLLAALGSIGVHAVDTLAALRATTGTGTRAVFMKCRATPGDGGHGPFVWQAGDQSANVTADPQAGIYVPPDSDITGASGAWRRLYSVAIDAKWFGAVGDGTTDDTSALSAAFAYAAASAQGKVKLFPSVYRIGSAVALSSNLDIDLNGSTIKHLGSTLHAMFTGSSLTDVSIRNGIIDGDQSNVSIYTAGRWDRIEAIEFTDCTDVTLDSLEITAHRGQAVYFTGCTRFNINKCYIHDCDNWAVVGKSSTDVVMTKNHVATVYTHGLYVDGTTSPGSLRVRMMDNTVLGVKHDASYTDSGVGLSVHSSGTPVEETQDVQIVGNVAKACESMGFSLTATNNATTTNGKMTVFGNLSEGHTSNVGIGFEIICSNALVANNIAKNNKYGATVQQSDNVTFSNNEFIASSSSQIGLIASPAGATDEVTGLTVIGNTFIGGTGFQVSATAAPHEDFNISDNTFIDTEYSVLMQSAVTRFLVANNLVNYGSATAGRGPQVVGIGSVLNNDITANTTNHGVVVGGASTSIIIQGNTVRQGTTGIFNNSAVTRMVLGNNDVAGATTAHNITGVTTLVDLGGNSWNLAAAAPTTMTWHAGQRVYNSAPAGGESNGWVCVTAGTPGTWVPFGVLNSVSADKGDAAATLTVLSSDITNRWLTPLTADRAVTLSTTGAWNGAKFRIVRGAGATGAFNLNVGTGPLKALSAAGQWCEVEFYGSAWILTAYGTL